MIFKSYDIIVSNDFTKSDNKIRAVSNKYKDETISGFSIENFHQRNSEQICIKIYEYNRSKNAGVKTSSSLIEQENFILERNGVPILIRIVFICLKKRKVYINSDCKESTMHTLVKELYGIGKESIRPSTSIEDLEYFNEIKIEENMNEKINIFNSEKKFDSLTDLAIATEDIETLTYILKTKKYEIFNKKNFEKLLGRSGFISIKGKNKDGKDREFNERFHEKFNVKLVYKGTVGLDSLSLKEISDRVADEI